MMSAGHPFRQEALKILSGRLEETDSASRHKILSYCEHLRASYETRDIDFIRQVFSDDALIIVGHVVRSREGYNTALTDNSKVRYSIRSKKEYLEKLSHIFNSGKDIDVRFSEFRIMRHATAKEYMASHFDRIIPAAHIVTTATCSFYGTSETVPCRLFMCVHGNRHPQLLPVTMI